MSTQGHVTTTDNDGVPLLLLFLLDKQEDVDELQEDLDDQVHVLRTFATAWNRGVKVTLVYISVKLRPLIT